MHAAALCLVCAPPAAIRLRRPSFRIRWLIHRLAASFVDPVFALRTRPKAPASSSLPPPPTAFRPLAFSLSPSARSIHAASLAQPRSIRAPFLPIWLPFSLTPLCLCFSSPRLSERTDLAVRFAMASASPFCPNLSHSFHLACIWFFPHIALVAVAPRARGASGTPAWRSQTLERPPPRALSSRRSAARRRPPFRFLVDRNQTVLQEMSQSRNREAEGRRGRGKRDRRRARDRHDRASGLLDAKGEKEADDRNGGRETLGCNRPGHQTTRATSETRGSCERGGRATLPQSRESGMKR